MYKIYSWKYFYFKTGDEHTDSLDILLQKANLINNRLQQINPFKYCFVFGYFLKWKLIWRIFEASKKIFFLLQYILLFIVTIFKRLELISKSLNQSNCLKKCQIIVIKILRNSDIITTIIAEIIWLMEMNQNRSLFLVFWKNRIARIVHHY